MNERNVLHLFTHNDLDGTGCDVLARMYATGRFTSSTVAYCAHESVNYEVNKLLDMIELMEKNTSHPVERRHIFITDICVDLPTAQRLDNFWKDKEMIKLTLIDHHQISEEIQLMEWVHTNTAPDTCATKLLYSYLYPQMEYLFKCQAINQFVEDVCLYDTWRFDKQSESNAENLNIFLWLLGHDEFVSTIISNMCKDPDEKIIVSEYDMYPFVERNRKQRKEYCGLRATNVRRINYKEYTVGVVFAEQFISSVGDKVLDLNQDIDFCAVVSLPKSVSLRTRRDDVNMGLDIAKPLGGGGHPKAAGYSLEEIPEDLLKAVIGMGK